MTSKQQRDNTATPVQEGPKGHELASGISFRKMNELAGDLAAQTRTPQKVGSISGVAYQSIPDTGKYGDFYRLQGDFLAICHPRGNQIPATELYLPKSLERGVNAAIEKQGKAILVWEVWAIYDPRPDNARKYRYAAYVQDTGEIPESRRLAAMAGFIELPPVPTTAVIEDRRTVEQGTYDPETGEVIPDRLAAE